MSKLRNVIFVTGNANKLKEVQAILGTQSVQLHNQKIDLPEYQGDPDDIVRHKCLAAYSHVKKPVLVEDTSLCYRALKGMPGPYVKWFLEKIGPEGLHKILDGYEDKGAEAMCIFGYTEDGENVKVIRGICPGEIVLPRGDTTFGWDPCFKPDGHNQTFAEMDGSVKNSISHRGRALQQLKDFFDSQK